MTGEDIYVGTADNMNYIFIFYHFIFGHFGDTSVCTADNMIYNSFIFLTQSCLTKNSKSCVCSNPLTIFSSKKFVANASEESF